MRVVKQSDEAGAISAQTRVFDMSKIEWQATGKEGLFLKPAWDEPERGHFLGMVRFAPFVRSGVHQHLGPASSFFLSGGLHDHQGYAGKGELGINLPGALHDAVSYEHTVLASRLEGPVIYPDINGQLHGLHSGSSEGDANRRGGEDLPDLNIRVDDVITMASPIPGLRRQSVYTYDTSYGHKRIVQVQLQPGTVLPRHRYSASSDWFIRAGDVSVNGQTGHAGDFVEIEPGAKSIIRSAYGCIALVWIDGPTHWVEPPPTDGDLYGFPLQS